jgi:hypothetical protein
MLEGDEDVGLDGLSGFINNQAADIPAHFVHFV